MTCPGSHIADSDFMELVRNYPNHHNTRVNIFTFIPLAELSILPQHIITTGDYLPLVVATASSLSSAPAIPDNQQCNKHIAFDSWCFPCGQWHVLCLLSQSMCHGF